MAVTLATTTRAVRTTTGTTARTIRANTTPRTPCRLQWVTPGVLRATPQSLPPLTLPLPLPPPPFVTARSPTRTLTRRRCHRWGRRWSILASRSPTCVNVSTEGGAKNGALPPSRRRRRGRGRGRRREVPRPSVSARHYLAPHGGERISGGAQGGCGAPTCTPILCTSSSGRASAATAVTTALVVVLAAMTMTMTAAVAEAAAAAVGNITPVVPGCPSLPLFDSLPLPPTSPPPLSPQQYWSTQQHCSQGLRSARR